jgi:uncharacterized protein YutD
MRSVWYLTGIFDIRSGDLYHEEIYSSRRVIKVLQELNYLVGHWKTRSLKEEGSLKYRKRNTMRQPTAITKQTKRSIN